MPGRAWPWADTRPDEDFTRVLRRLTDDGQEEAADRFDNFFSFE